MLPVANISVLLTFETASYGKQKPQAPTYIQVNCSSSRAMTSSAAENV